MKPHPINERPLFKTYPRLLVRDLMRHHWPLRIQMIASDTIVSAFYLPADVEFAKGVVRRRWGMRHHAFKRDIRATVKQRAWTRL